MSRKDTLRRIDQGIAGAGGAAVSVTLAGSSGGVSNADTVDGYHASSTRTAGKLLALDANARFTPAVINWSSVAGAGLGASGNTLVVQWGTSPTTIVPDAAANGGSAATSARSDHTHAIAAAVAGSIQPDATAAEGTSTSFARADHVHAIAAAAPASNLHITSANAEGDATSFARSNHLHAITSSANPGAAASILASSASGYLQLVRLGAGVAPSYALHAQGTTPQLRIQSDATHYATFGADGSGNLTITPSGNSLLLPSGKTLSSANWASQTTGWGIYPESTHGRDGYADFRYIYSDELHVKMFIADLEQALAGGQIISKSVAILAADFTIPAKGSNGWMYVEDLPGTTAAVFAAGDWIRLRNISRSGGGLVVADAYGTVGAATFNGNGTQSYTFTRPAGDTGSAAEGTVILKGGLVLDYGISGNGYWEVTTLDPAGSPYAQVATWATHPQNLTVRVRLGNLDGIAGIGAEWGFWAGTDVNHQFKASSAGVELRGIPQYWLDAGNNTRGAVDPTATGSDYLFWLGPSSGDKRFGVNASGTVYIGNVPSQNVAGWAHGGDITKIDGGAIYANTVTAASLLVHGANWVANSGFETGTFSGWAAKEGSPYVSNYQPRSGAYCLRATGDGETAKYVVSGPLLPVDANRNYFMSVWVRNATGTGGAGIIVQWIDAADAIISTAGSYSAATAGWTQKSAVAAAPSNARYVRLMLTIRADNAVNVGFDDVEFYPADGQVLVGAPSGARVEINSSGIEGYSDADTRQFYIRTSDGRAMFGEGKGVLDRSGLMLSGSETTVETFNSVRWLNGTLPSGTEIARLSAGRWADSAPTVELIANDPQDATNASVTVTAKGKVFSTHGSHLFLRSWQGSPYGAAAEAQLMAVDDTATCVWTLGQGSIRGMVYTGAFGVERMRLQLGNSATVPTLAIGGDLNTGIWQSAADNLDFSTGGVNRVNISNNGLLEGIAAGGFRAASGDINFLDDTNWRTVATVEFTSTTYVYGGGLLFVHFGGSASGEGLSQAYWMGPISRAGTANPVAGTAFHSSASRCLFQIVALSTSTLAIQLKCINSTARLGGTISLSLYAGSSHSLTLTAPGYTN